MSQTYEERLKNHHNVGSPHGFCNEGELPGECDHFEMYWARVSVMTLSKWIDESANNIDQPYGTVLLNRTVVKIAEELGEVADALIGWQGQNPRKGIYASKDDVTKELLDVALTALCAVEFMTDNNGKAMGKLFDHIKANRARAGI